jgi:hypothetical protein
MAVRVPLNHTSRAASGAVPASASMYVYLRGTTTQVNLYAASSGGSVLTQPISPDANGNYTQYVEQSGQYDFVETQNSVVQPTIRRDLVAGATEAWVAPTFVNSWVNYGGTMATAGYTITQDVMVKLKGTVKNGTAGSTIFTLPAGFRPDADMYFPAASGTSVGRVLVTSAGVVQQSNGVTTEFGLDNVFFRKA